MTLAAGHYSAFDRSRFLTDRASVVSSSDHIRNRIEAATGDVIGVAARGRNDRQFDIDNTVRAARHALDEGPGAALPPTGQGSVGG